jgi:hypothetical protein
LNEIEKPKKKSNRHHHYRRRQQNNKQEQAKLMNTGNSNNNNNNQDNKNFQSKNIILEEINQDSLSAFDFSNTDEFWEDDIVTNSKLIGIDNTMSFHRLNSNSPLSQFISIDIEEEENEFVDEEEEEGEDEEDDSN